jgi:hypothetical protein
MEGRPRGPALSGLPSRQGVGPVRASNGAPNFLALPHTFYASLVLLESEAAAISHEV